MLGLEPFHHFFFSFVLNAYYLYYCDGVIIMWYNNYLIFNSNPPETVRTLSPRCDWHQGPIYKTGSWFISRARAQQLDSRACN